MVKKSKSVFLTLILTIVISVLLFLGFITALKKCVYKTPYSVAVRKCAKEFDLDEYLIYSVIKVESSFNERAVSNKGAVGLMQIREQTGEYIASSLNEKEYDLYNGETNVRFGCYYIRYLINKFQEEKTALCAYNAGEGTVRTWLKDERYSKDGKTLYNVPYAETREYIEKIYKCYGNYKKLYSNFLDKEEKFK